MVRGIGNLLRSRAMRQLPSLHHEHSSYQWWVLANVMIGTFMAVLDATIVNVALPKIMAAFGVGVDKVEWILTAYLLVFAVMLGGRPFRIQAHLHAGAFPFQSRIVPLRHRLERGCPDRFPHCPGGGCGVPDAGRHGDRYARVPS